MFDPYHAWLAIPRNQRPPTYYQLLGIAATETDRRVIEEAAIRRMSQIRIYQAGPYEQECVRLLNEIAAAETILLHPAKRQAYNAQLTQRVAADRKARQRTDSRKRPALCFPALERCFALPDRPLAAGASPFEELGELEPIIEFRAPPDLAPWHEAVHDSDRSTAEDPSMLFRFEQERRRCRRRRSHRAYWPDALVVLYLGCLILAGVLGFCFGK